MGAEVSHVGHATRPSPRDPALRRDHDRRRGDDRVGHLPGQRRHRPHRRQRGLVACRVALQRSGHAAGRRLLRRTGGADAASGRPVRLPARDLRAPGRLPLRLDPVHGDPDRLHRGRGDGLRQARGAAGAGARRAERAADRGLAGVQRGASRGHREHRAADLAQHPRPARGQAGAGRLHGRQGRRAAGPGGRRPRAGAQRRGDRGQLPRLLGGEPGRDRRRRRGVARGPGRSRAAHGPRRGLRRFALRVRRVEQRHLHQRRDRGPAADHHPRAGRRRRRGRGPLHADEPGLRAGAAGRRRSGRGRRLRPRPAVRDGRPRRHRGGIDHPRPGRRRGDGGAHHDQHLRLQQRHDPHRRAGLLRHGARRALLPPHRHAQWAARAGRGAGAARGVVVRALPHRAGTATCSTT